MILRRTGQVCVFCSRELQSARERFTSNFYSAHDVYLMCLFFCDDCVVLGHFLQCLRRSFVVESFSKPNEFENYMGEFGMCGGYNPNSVGTPEVLFSCGTEVQCLAGLVFSMQ